MNREQVVLWDKEIVMSMIANTKKKSVHSSHYPFDLLIIFHFDKKERECESI